MLRKTRILLAGVVMTLITLLLLDSFAENLRRDGRL